MRVAMISRTQRMTRFEKLVVTTVRVGMLWSSSCICTESIIDGGSTQKKMRMVGLVRMGRKQKLEPFTIP